MEQTGAVGDTKEDEVKDTIESKAYDKGILGSVTFVNGKVLAQYWDIIKCSSQSTGLHLPDAEFELTDNKNQNVIYYGKTDENGNLDWYTSRTVAEEGVVYSNPVASIPKGEYTLTETKAPVGYLKSLETWTLKIAKSGALSEISSSASDSIETQTVEDPDGKIIVYFLYKNQTAYNLPDSGGPGIFWSLIGGVLLMMAAALIIYKNKCREVLRG